MTKYVLAADVGGTRIRVGLVNERYELTASEAVFRRDILHDRPGHELADYLYRWMQTQGVTVSAVAVGCPSTLDAARRMVLSTPNIPGMDALPLADILEERFGVPVYLERDVSMLFTYDRMRFSIPDTGISLGIYFGTGLGNAIAVDGQLLSGADGAAGELGHIPVLGAQGECGCGNVGCLELSAGGKYLAQIAAEKGSDISTLFMDHPDCPEVQHYLEAAACAVATEVNILNPISVVIGGGVPAMAGFPRSQLTDAILAHTRKPYPYQSLHLLWSEDAALNGVLGGGIYAFQMLHQEGKQ